METREDLRSILPFLPVFLRSSSLFYPPQVIQAVKSLSNGPTHSNVNSGEILILAITDIRHSLGLSSLSSYASEGYTLFFDELMSRVAAAKWFEETVPRLAGLLLRLPGLLEDHYNKSGRINNNNTLRLLESQAAGVVVLSQELIGALLSCALFCLFPTSSRDEKHLPLINFDYLFASLCPNYSQNQENKIMCLVHYFERISACMPMGFVSFERKVLGVNDNHHYVSYPNFAFWRMSKVSLCSFEVCPSGLIEDQLNEALEVDFANKYLGGGALSRGCVQEEIRFMINPELIVGMLFLPSMADNEAIEIVGAERFSNYTGYASTFLFAGDYLDKKPRDGLGRRKTRIVAIDALCSPRLRQYGAECLLREINKAFCGFYDQSKYHIYQKCFQDYEFCQDQPGRTSVVNDHTELAEEMEESPSRATGQHEARGSEWIRNLNEEYSSDSMDTEDNVGIVTGNWGCGAFGGDPELKAAIQWLAASQALRPFISYYTFQDKALLYLDQVTTWILAQGWTVGDLWNMLAEYSSQRTKGETKAGFFRWLLPALNGNTKSTLSET